MGGHGFDGGDIIWLAPSSGKLVNKKKEIEWYMYEGMLVSINVVEKEYEGHPYKQVQVKMKDDDEVVMVCFSLASWYAKGFFERIEAVDVAQQFQLGSNSGKDGGKVSFCWIHQHDNPDADEKGRLPKDDTVPKPRDDGMGNKDWSDLITIGERTVKSIQSKLKQVEKPKEKPKPRSSEDSPPEDDLPF